MAAMRFSNPFPSRFENGMLAGSAQTRSTFGVTRSGRCCAWAAPGRPRPVASATSPARASVNPARLVLSAETRLFGIFCSLWLFISLLRPAAVEGTIGAGPEIDVDVIQIADDILVGTERRHDAGIAAAGNLPTLNDNLGELLVGHGLQRVRQGGSIRRPRRVGTVTGMT